MSNLSKADIRNGADCPTCGAKSGEPCTFTGKGAAKKMRQGRNHESRSWAVQGNARLGIKALRREHRESRERADRNSCGGIIDIEDSEGFVARW